MPFPCGEVWGASTYSGHNAIDWNLIGANDSGRRVEAGLAGTVTTALGNGQWNNGYGNYVIVAHGDGWSSLYAHLSAVSVSAGQAVAANTMVGAVGTTGNSTGSHLHWEQRLNGNKRSPLYANGTVVNPAGSPDGNPHTSHNCGGPIRTPRDVNGDGRADLAIIGTAAPTGSGRLEAHVLNGATGYSTWLAHWATVAGFARRGDKFVMGDVNDDGRADLAMVNTKSPTGSGRLEVHVLNGATGYSTWLLHAATPAGFTRSSDRIVMGDVNGDGRADVGIIGTAAPTGSGRLEAHILNGATGYSTWLAHWATAAGFARGSDKFVMGDVNDDGRADLAMVNTKSPTGSGRLEVHVLNGATGYSTWLLHAATPAGFTRSSDRIVMGDVNGDGRADVGIIGTAAPTGSGRLEAHILNGATGYSTWLAHWATAAGFTRSTDRIVMGG